MGKFIARIKLEHASQKDYQGINARLHADQSLYIDHASTTQKGDTLNIEYQTRGNHTLPEIMKLISRAVEKTAFPSSFFVIKDKGSN